MKVALFEFGFGWGSDIENIRTHKLAIGLLDIHRSLGSDLFRISLNHDIFRTNKN